MEMFRVENPDIIITDLVMPRSDGFSFISELRQITSIPVIAMSRREIPGTLEALRDLGATTFICKTNAPITFLIQIKNALERFAT